MRWQSLWVSHSCMVCKGSRWKRLYIYKVMVHQQQSSSSRWLYSLLGQLAIKYRRTSGVPVCVRKWHKTHRYAQLYFLDQISTLPEWLSSAFQSPEHHQLHFTCIKSHKGKMNAMKVCKLLYKQPVLDLIKSEKNRALCYSLVSASFGLLNFMVNAKQSLRTLWGAPKYWRAHINAYCSSRRADALDIFFKQIY